MTRNRVSIPAILCLAGFGLAACGGSDGVESNLPYDIDTTLVIYPDGTVEEHATPNGGDCIDLGPECVEPQTLCGSEDARVDLVVDSEGNLIEYVCYHIEDDGVIIATDSDTIASAPGEVIVVEDGVVIDGDVDLNGANTVVYSSIDGATINGDVRLSGQNTIARGVRITGNLDLFGGGVAALFVIVEGSVFVPGNGALLANSVVFGDIIYTGSNFDFAGNALQGNLDTSAALGLCLDNTTFEDLDGNLILDRDVEVTGDLPCP